jgi:transcriptional regulator with XRE-family HTH domain
MADHDCKRRARRAAEYAALRKSRLKRWMRAHSLNDQQVAQALGVDRSAVHRWLHGARPNEKHLIALHNLTRGEVTPNDFYDLQKFYRLRDDEDEDEITG